MEWKEFKDKKIILEDIENFLIEMEDLDVLVEGIDHKSRLNKKFVIRLLNYLEKLFPTYGDFDSNMSAELRKYIRGDAKEFKKIKKNIHDILLKLKNRLLRDVQTKIGNIKVLEKQPDSVVKLEPGVEPKEDKEDNDDDEDKPKIPKTGIV